MKRRPQTQRHIGMERLENRELFAGNVMAYMSGNGDLNLLEATADIGEGQALKVHQIAANRFRVTGLSSQDGGTSLVNGVAQQDFTVTGNLNINLAGGRDTVVLGRSAPTTFNQVFLNSGVDSATGNADLDSISVEKVTTRGHLTVDSGASADFIKVLGSKIGDGYNIDNLSIDAGSGADYINLASAYGRFLEVTGNLSVDTYDSQGELHADRVIMQSAYAGGNVQAFLGGGDDSLAATDVFAGNDLFFSTDGGKDSVQLDSVRANDDFWAYMGEGDDSLDMQYLTADVLTLDGGSGYDRLSTAVPGPVNQQVISGWEEINGRKQVYYNWNDGHSASFERS